MEKRTDDKKNMRQVPTNIVAVKDDRLTTLCRVVFFAFVVLFALEFLGKNYLWLYIGFAFFLLTTRFLRFRLEIIPLLVLSLSMIFFSGSLPGLTELLRIFAFPLCYLVGSNLWVEKDSEKLSLKKQENLLKWSVYAFALGTFAHFCLNFAINFGTGADRNTIDVWSGAVRSATNQAAFGILTVGVAIALFFSNRKTLKKIAAIVMLAVVVVYALTLAGRTIFVIIAAVGVAALLFMWLKNPNRTKTFWVSCLLFLLAVTAMALFVFNAFGIRDVITGGNFYKRFFGESGGEGLSETSRWGTKAYYLEHFFEHIFGGSHLLTETGEYAHDILLDTYDQSGIFALLAVVVFLIISLYQTVAFVADRRFSFNVRQLVLCISLVMAIEFCVEPIFYGMPWLFCAFCFMQGAIANARQNADQIAPLGVRR